MGPLSMNGASESRADTATKVLSILTGKFLSLQPLDAEYAQKLLSELKDEQRHRVAVNVMRHIASSLLFDEHMNVGQWKSTLSIIDDLKLSSSIVLGYRKLVSSLLTLFEGSLNPSRVSYKLADEAYNFGVNASPSEEKRELMQSALLAQLIAAPSLPNFPSREENPVLKAYGKIIDRISKDGDDPSWGSIDREARLSYARALFQHGKPREGEFQLALLEIVDKSAKKEVEAFRDEMSHDVPILGRVLAATKEAISSPYAFDDFASAVSLLSETFGDRARRSVAAFNSGKSAVSDEAMIASAAQLSVIFPFRARGGPKITGKQSATPSAAPKEISAANGVGVTIDVTPEIVSPTEGLFHTSVSRRDLPAAVARLQTLASRVFALLDPEKLRKVLEANAALREQVATLKGRVESLERSWGKAELRGEDSRIALQVNFPVSVADTVGRLRAGPFAIDSTKLGVVIDGLMSEGRRLGLPEEQAIEAVTVGLAGHLRAVPREERLALLSMLSKVWRERVLGHPDALIPLKDAVRGEFESGRYGVFDTLSNLPQSRREAVVEGSRPSLVVGLFRRVTAGGRGDNPYTALEELQRAFAQLDPLTARQSVEGVFVSALRMGLPSTPNSITLRPPDIMSVARNYLGDPSKYALVEQLVQLSPDAAGFYSEVLGPLSHPERTSVIEQTVQKHLLSSNLSGRALSTINYLSKLPLDHPNRVRASTPEFLGELDTHVASSLLDATRALTSELSGVNVDVDPTAKLRIIDSYRTIVLPALEAAAKLSGESERSPVPLPFTRAAISEMSRRVKALVSSASFDARTAKSEASGYIESSVVSALRAMSDLFRSVQLRLGD